MRALVFALEFKGIAEPVGGSDKKLHARTTATSQTLRTTLGADSIQGNIEADSGGSAKFESDVEIVSEGTFIENGRIEYGGAGAVTFRTVGRGVLAPSPMAGLQRGAVIWEVTGGTGQLSEATGLITSNFTVGTAGEVTDDHFARLFIP